MNVDDDADRRDDRPAAHRRRQQQGLVPDDRERARRPDRRRLRAHRREAQGHPGRAVPSSSRTSSRRPGATTSEGRTADLGVQGRDAARRPPRRAASRARSWSSSRATPCPRTSDNASLTFGQNDPRAAVVLLHRPRARRPRGSTTSSSPASREDASYRSSFGLVNISDPLTSLYVQGVLRRRRTARSSATSADTVEPLAHLQYDKFLYTYFGDAEHRDDHQRHPHDLDGGSVVVDRREPDAGTDGLRARGSTTSPTTPVYLEQRFEPELPWDCVFNGLNCPTRRRPDARASRQRGHRAASAGRSSGRLVPGLVARQGPARANGREPRGACFRSRGSGVLGFALVRAASRPPRRERGNSSMADKASKVAQQRPGRLVRGHQLHQLQRVLHDRAGQLRDRRRVHLRRRSSRPTPTSSPRARKPRRRARSRRSATTATERSGSGRAAGLRGRPFCVCCGWSAGARCAAGPR